MPTIHDAVREVKNFARSQENYNRGWDIIIECWSDDELRAELKNTDFSDLSLLETQELAVSIIRPYVDLVEEYSWDIRAAAY